LRPECPYGEEWKGRAGVCDAAFRLGLLLYVGYFGIYENNLDVLVDEDGFGTKILVDYFDSN
jgi:hypothetical protein